MEECPYLLKVEEITETCVGAEGKRWYQVRWKSAWISDDVISPKIFQKTQNGKVHISGNNMIYEILDETQTEDGRIEFLLSCKDSWESEENLKRAFNPAITRYWTSKTKAEELIKIEETSDDEGVTCCAVRSKRKSSEKVVNLIPSKSPIKDERDVGVSKSCAENFLPTLSSDVDIPMQQLNLSTANVQSFESNIPEIQPKYDGIQLTSSSISSSSSYSLNTETSINNDVKAEKGINVTSCSQQLFDLAAVNNEKPLSPSMYPIENSCLADPCDLPADRFSPKILKVEDSFPNHCEELTTSKDNCLIPELDAAYPSILNSSSDGTTIVPSDIDKSTLLDNHSEFLSYSTSVKVPSEIIKIEDSDEPDSCIHHSLSSSNNRMPFSNPILSNSESAIGKNNENVPVPQITCKVECDDYPDSNQQPSILPPYPLASDNCTNVPNLPNLINVSAHLPMPEQIPHGACKSENKYESSCQQDIKPPRLLPDSNRPELATGGCCCSVPDKPPLLIRNDAVQHMHRFPRNFGTDKRLVHSNKSLSNVSTINDNRRLPIINNNNNQNCDICGKQFSDFNAMYQHRMSHGNDSMIPPMIKIKEEEDLDYNCNKDGNGLKDATSRVVSTQNPYMLPTDPHIAPNVHNIPRNEDFHPTMALKQSNLINPRITNAQNFRYATNCNVQPNHMLYSAPNQFDPTANSANKDNYFSNRMKPTNNPKAFIPEQIHGAVSSFKPNQQIQSSNRDSFISVNGQVSPHPFPLGKVPGHRLQMGINPDDGRGRMNEPPVNAQYCPASNSYMMMNDHTMSMPQAICKPGEYTPCISHDKRQQYRLRMQNPGAVRPLQSNAAKEHLFHPGQNPYMASNRHLLPTNFQQNQPPQNTSTVGENQPPNPQRMQMAPTHPVRMRYQNISAVTNRQFYPSQNQQYFPPNTHLNNHMTNNMPPNLTTIPENFPPNHNDIQSIQQHNGSRVDHQISPPNFPKCNMCGKQFPNYVALREHRATHHLNNQAKGMRVQIKEEVDTDYMPVPNSHFQNDEFMYNEANPYMSRNPHRLGINSSSAPNDFSNTMCKQEGQMNIPNSQIPLAPHGVNTGGVFNIHQNDNVSRQHGKFMPNPEVSMNSNSAISDANKIVTLQNPYMLPNGHIIPSSNYPTSNCKTEDSNNLIPMQPGPKDGLNPTSIQNSNSTASVEKTHKCDTCGETYTDYSKLKEHRKTHASEKQFSCELCDKTFTQNSTLKRHQRTHTREKPYKCEICGKSFSHNYNLKEHGKTHTGEKPYRCDICGKTFAQNYHLKEHQTTHSDAKPFKCDKCNKQFSLDSYLKKHQKIHTGEKPYKCDVCDKQFLQNSHLKDHRRIHTGEKPFKCEICAIRFSQNYTLKIHQRTHTGEKPYKCEICEKRFSQNSHLKEHRTRTHSGDKPFKCDQCHKEFSLDSYLKKHQKIHSGEKPFKCDICEKQFSQNYHLKEHRRIHTGEKPYKCQICEMRFSQNCSLKIHQRIHTGEKPYECEICGKQFSHSSNVKTHKRVHLTEKVKANVNPTVVSISYPPPVDSKVNILPSIPEIPQPVIATS